MNYSIEMVTSFMFLLIGFSFVACYAQRLYIQYRLDKIKERRGNDDEIKERMDMIDRTERIKNDDFYIYL